MQQQQIKHLADLARIEISEEETKNLQSEMKEILNYVEQINEVAAEEGAARAGEHRNIMREDENPHKSGAYTDELLHEVPREKDGYVQVKKIIS